MGLVKDVGVACKRNNIIFSELGIVYTKRRAIFKHLKLTPMQEQLIRSYLVEKGYTINYITHNPTIGIAISASKK